jgi:glutamate dehydrogenase (NAD(P)+)
VPAALDAARGSGADWPVADELGPAKIVHVREPVLGLEAVLVVDNVARGPSIGGLRMAPDVSAEECARLARAMTLKNAAAGLAHGGGKSVLRGDPRMPADRKERLVRAFAHALRHEADYIFGPDMGTDETCMGWVADEIGRAVGLPSALGGIPLDEIGATGWGLRHAAEVAAPYCGLDLKGARVAIQGFGAVGKHGARFLGDAGAVLVAASDSQGTVHRADGLDVARLIALKEGGRSVVEHEGARRLPGDAILDVPCDIWIPAARPDVVREDNAGRLATRLVLQGANIPFTPGAEQALHERGVLVIPDFIANAGGVICAAMEYRGATQGAAFAAIQEKIRANTRAVLDHAAAAGDELPPLLDPLTPIGARRATGNLDSRRAPRSWRCGKPSTSGGRDRPAHQRRPGVQRQRAAPLGERAPGRGGTRACEPRRRERRAVYGGGGSVARASEGTWRQATRASSAAACQAASASASSFAVGHAVPSITGPAIVTSFGKPAPAWATWTACHRSRRLAAVWIVATTRRASRSRSCRVRQASR